MQKVLIKKAQGGALTDFTQGKKSEGQEST